jgi:hypothetical protein
MDALYSLVPHDAPGLTILTPDGLWAAITHWDLSDAGAQNKFMWGTETENKYQLAAFLANANQESLAAFAHRMNPNYGINEIVCDGNVGRVGPAGEFIQDPTPCSNAWGGEYGLYWGRGAMQVTCRKGSGPGGSDFCPAYSDLNVYYKDYLTSRGWTQETIEREPYRVALDPTLAWGSALVYWMGNKGAGCYTCHQWAKLRDFAGTVETINGGWANGESPMSHPPSSRQQNRVDGFLRATTALGLDADADGWNGLAVTQPSPCERYFLPSKQYCFEQTPPAVCAAAALPPVPVGDRGRGGHGHGQPHNSNSNSNFNFNNQTANKAEEE